jgi:hypothetical protein
MRGLVVALALAGCGDDLASVAATGPDAGVQACTAAFSGAFAESSTSIANCATVELSKAPILDHRMLEFSLPVFALQKPLAVSLDLGLAPAPGAYTSENVTSWSAVGFQMTADGWCAYKAGSDASPQGTFALTLDAIELPIGVAHGTLVIEQPVLSFAYSTCGPPFVERIELRF